MRHRRREARFASLDPRVWAPGPREAGCGEGRQVPSSTQTRVFRRLQGVVRPNPVLAPITTGRESSPARGTVLGIQSGRRCPTLCSTVAASCPLPPSVSFPVSRTSSSLRCVPNRFPMSSRACRLLPPWSSPLGGLGGRLARCWPTYEAGIHQRRARTPTGPQSSGLRHGVARSG
ncbi:hypothetical protein T02_15981 [Trichinella nativa]|uniref:Uncharacterized protein n=1 Tax=Trichinella nativa TaxID=6335 RepID=A0A0V1LFX9_9BILA|nr:hypothetical protein T02_15981 [Trichinella nativa]